ncbi:MAG: AAA family ATPase [Deltaproteobacteria bacterium]|nr:AAA family ATPase [Deltaproteobacteria bacterium]
MSVTIAMAGKGGTGKTTLAGWAVKYLLSQGRKPVLAVDADSNSNLNEVLGLQVNGTLGQAREEMKTGGLPGMTKDIFMEMKVNQILVETDGYDLLVMGRPEGAGCYCAANNLLSNIVEKLTDNYPYVVIDNEAGMEHISRLTTRKIDIFYVISDPTRRGITAARRIWDLVDEMNISVGRKYLILNQVKDEVGPEMLAVIEGEGLNLAGSILADDEIYQYDQAGRPTAGLWTQNPAVAQTFDIFSRTMFDAEGNA